MKVANYHTRIRENIGRNLPKVCHICIDPFDSDSQQHEKEILQTFRASYLGNVSDERTIHIKDEDLPESTPSLLAILFASIRPSNPLNAYQEAYNYIQANHKNTPVAVTMSYASDYTIKELAQELYLDKELKKLLQQGKATPEIINRLVGSNSLEFTWLRKLSTRKNVFSATAAGNEGKEINRKSLFPEVLSVSCPNEVKIKGNKKKKEVFSHYFVDAFAPFYDITNKKRKMKLGYSSLATPLALAQEMNMNLYRGGISSFQRDLRQELQSPILSKLQITSDKFPPNKYDIFYSYDPKTHNCIVYVQDKTTKEIKLSAFKNNRKNQDEWLIHFFKDNNQIQPPQDYINSLSLSTGQRNIHQKKKQQIHISFDLN